MQPITALDDNGPYTFRIFSENHFLDLTRTYLYLESKLQKKNDDGDWEAIGNADADANVSVVQNYGNSFIKRFDIKINGTEIFSSGTNYAYRAYLNHELFTSTETRRTLSEAICYYQD